MPWTNEIEDDDEGGDDLGEWADDDHPDDVLLHCPSCKREVHEDTQQCPFCGDWIIPVDLSDRPQRRIWLIVVILLIAAFAGVVTLIR